MKKYEKVLVGKTSINVSGIDIDVNIVRNESGNLEVQGYMGYFPNGTCIEGRNDEIEFYGYELNKKTLNNGGVIETIDVDPDVVIDEIRKNVEFDRVKRNLKKEIDDLKIKMASLEKNHKQLLWNNHRDSYKKKLEVGSNIFHKEYGCSKVVDINDTHIFIHDEWIITAGDAPRKIKSFTKDSYIAKTLVVL